jgi:hypothetical protein
MCSISFSYFQVQTLKFRGCLHSVRSVVQGDQKVSVHLTNNPHTIDELKVAITEYIRNVDRAILNTKFATNSRTQFSVSVFFFFKFALLL